MKVKCKLAGRRLEDISGNVMACVGCSGVLVKSGNQLRHENPVRIMFSFPRKGIEYKPEYKTLIESLTGNDSFNCPATVVAFINGELSEEVKKLVEVVE